MKSRTQAPNETVPPAAVYGCQYGNCWEHASYPPHMLYWLADLKIWICENCFSCLDDNQLSDEDQELGETLQDFFDRKAMINAIEAKGNQ